MKLIKANETNFFEILIEKINKIDSINNGIYIFAEFSIDLGLKKDFKKQIVPSAIKNYYKF